MDNRTAEEKSANPILGDIRLTKEYPPGTPLNEITEFEVWDGSRWVSSKEGNSPIEGLVWGEFPQSQC